MTMATFAGFAMTGGTGGAFTDKTFQTYTSDTGVRGGYHLYASGIDQNRSIGLMVQFHGDGAYEYNNPDSPYSLGGPNGIRAQALKHNLILLVVQSPDTQGTRTWWESGSRNADYARELITRVTYDKYNIDDGRVWLNGYSGGAQFITQYYLPRYSSSVQGGGAVIFGGGGVPQIPVSPISPNLKQRFAMHWYTGALDDGSCSSDGYNALGDARRGSEYYRGLGFGVTLETPAGVCHDLDGRFGPVTGQQLDLHDNSDTTMPTISITSPRDRQTVTGIIDLDVSASDNVGVARVDFSIDYIYAGTDSTPPYKLTINTNNLSNGEHVLRARAFDTANNHTPTGITVVVDNTVSQPGAAPPSASPPSTPSTTTPSSTSPSTPGSPDTSVPDLGVDEFSGEGELPEGVVEYVEGEGDAYYDQDTAQYYKTGTVNKTEGTGIASDPTNGGSITFARVISLITGLIFLVFALIFGYRWLRKRGIEKSVEEYYESLPDAAMTLPHPQQAASSQPYTEYPGSDGPPIIGRPSNLR